MDAPPVHYATTSDGFSIAYCEAGSGSPIVQITNALGHVEYSRRFYASWYQGLAERFRLVWFDPRGGGLSDRGLPPDFSNSDYVLDFEAVIDALNLNDVILFGMGVRCHAAVRYAVKHPQRVKALVLVTTCLEGRGFPQSFLQDLSRENWEFFLMGMMSGVPPGAEEARLKELRESCTPEDWQTTVRGSINSSIEFDATVLSTPALILHPRDYRMVNTEEGRKVAARIPHASFVLISGDTVYGDAAEGIAAIERFLSSLPSSEERKAIALPGHLSPREVEVLRLLAAGKHNQEIAEELVISLNTVRKHVSNVLDKTSSSNRAQAAVYARDHGLT
jgi:DNA-binding CsgD family transcriptional regulator/pimeloyl-ACP methyl ester carboxylesterase